MSRNVPKIRFPEFTGEWEEKKLGDIVEVYDGTHQTPDYKKSGVKFVSVENINNLSGSKKFISKEAFDKDFKVKPQRGDILMTRIGDIGTPTVIRTDEEYAYYVSLALLRPKYSNSEYIEQYIRAPYFQRELHDKTLHIAFPKKINKGDIGECKLKEAPHKEEQTKIANFLSTLDSRITVQTEKVEILDKTKKGYMQRIFSQELRFKREDGSEYPDWEEKRLGDISSIKTGKLDANAMVENGEYRFYTCAKDYYYIDRYAYDTDALLVSGNGANVGYIHHYKGKFNAYQRTYILDKFAENIVYVKYFMERYLPKRILDEKNDGNTPYIVLSTLTDMPIQLPSIEEQTKIADFLSTLDTKLEVERKMLETLQGMKKGFLQKMFV